MAKHVLCDMSEVPEGSCKSFTIEGTRIALYNVMGEFYATQNHCTHKGAQLVKGELEGSVIECSQHGWKFDVKTGECLAPKHGRKLRLYPISIGQTSVTVELQDKSKTQPAAKTSQPADQSMSKLEFHAVANTDDLEDEEVMAVDVGDEEIALYRIEGKFYATHGLCTHEHVKLADGFVEGDRIECPLHSACFDIKTGKAVNPPAEIDLKTYPVKLNGNTVFVGIETG
ncbi:MAG: non-heme iron oxygenase ferredoxin subunit [Gammaproteobacteria bacterium]|nr:non-heme iron oxygenase ferredoxin subunit [Gammaproteobacteria bacterium]MDH3467312.1 non-heme iron oxygenase ferredoxin subunit [Gammaproteobacteria bacterium]